ncbi:PLP-dependent aminotransferase family protein [Streptosporangium sp. NBC_01639]|uniref:MocR-like pyridoxine biosynthesis transcription factor PdxR n=1 Tax=Streptosporangium sp. NBC_01639 TaxID=2975948 RepID=UPI003863B204|nr:PLP-dependent aminotransferase family protein [Streptosporangium sp. NBC_01639]
MHVSLEGRTDLAGQIYQQIRAAVLDGRLRHGEPLPATRELARDLLVSRNTVSTAYDRLAAEGFVEGRIGVGTFVHAEALPPASLRMDHGRLRPRAVWQGIPIPGGLDRQPRYDFRPGLPDVRMFPYEAWRRLVSRELRSSAVGSGMYGDPLGHAGLRAAIARHVGVSRAVRADPDTVVVTSGAQQALDLIGRVLLEPGDRVAVEDPGYPPPRWLFESMGLRVTPVPVDAEGLVVDALPADARAVYVTPSHQFPLGMPMSLARRMALLAWAEERGAAVIEDDYDSEFRYGGRPIEPLQNLDRSGRVLYVGSFSKVMLPTLRLGFLVAPPALLPALGAAKYVTDWTTPIPGQAALAGFIDEGLLARHIRRMRTEYEARRQRVVQRLAGSLDLVTSAAGLHTSGFLPAGRHDVARRARDAGIGLMPLSDFAVHPSRPGLVVGYGAIPLDRIDDGLTRLLSVIDAENA